MPKVPKQEETKLTVLIPEPEQIVSDSEAKSPVISPRLTRKTAAILAMSENKPSTSTPRPEYNTNPQRTFTPSTQGPPRVFCRYCKTAGHDISSCKKREYNNNRYRFYPNSSNTLNSPRSPPRVNFVDQPDEQIGQDEVDVSLAPLNE
ncbi:hypothetical protein K1T71_013202 [Dendrolimus kikuchii]|uniref:Uncharacterized protein n=1 Tax=Dendrolimus kikuchii TaxID=765133 RepID=A0ACC1CHD7_9NEOP|nr:hypothetical protein K1T71_013202 [Dendrolimus kikuchii]